MKTYIAMLRGINVSGQKKIKMAELRAHLAELDFQNVQTYIQSGNIIFQYADTPHPELEEMIHNKIKEKYGFEVPTLVKQAEDFGYVIQNNPFLEEPEKDIKRQYITFLAETPAREHANNINAEDYLPEEYVLDGDVIFFFSPSGYGRARMNNNFFEKKLKVKATTRNWKTVNKLYDMSKEADQPGD